jgi:hypothetical protein
MAGYDGHRGSVNLSLRSANADVLAFCQRLGYGR